MIPLLILSKDPKLIKNYVDKLKSGNLFFEIFPSTKEYSIEDIKGLKKETKVFHPKIRVYLLANFHLSSIPAQNSFLKLLEEPPSDIQFILTTDNKNNLLPTIVSRTKIVKLQGKDSQNVVEAQFIAPIIKEMIHQGASTKIPLLQFKTTDRESANNILHQIIIFFRKRLEFDKNSPLIIKEILRLIALLENNNLNPQLTIDQVLIFIWKTYRMK